ncbi:hypothetical protein EVAR_49923_1 [Eumeta japonica]|uniref:Uncharacterized protein n=1 Tax=Eumeta variegata TaxID=151549 RepID=A0A4C1Y078_EUMVA|nr:hypothetical protein EVAR_49923_1 [Eumeta japonica]
MLRCIDSYVGAPRVCHTSSVAFASRSAVIGAVLEESRVFHYPSLGGVWGWRRWMAKFRPGNDRSKFTGRPFCILVANYLTIVEDIYCLTRSIPRSDIRYERRPPRSSAGVVRYSGGMK